MSAIKRTDEMLNTFRDEWMRSMSSDPRTKDPERIADGAGIEAVLGIVERDYRVQPRETMCDAADPEEPDMTCLLMKGHTGSHWAETLVPQSVTW